MAFFGVWGLARLPQPYFPAFKNPRFRRVTDDGFFIIIEARDPGFVSNRPGNCCSIRIPPRWKRSED